jgi:NAD+ kinase
MQVAIYNRVFDPGDILSFRHIYEALRDVGADIMLFKDLYERLKHHIDFDETPRLFTSPSDLDKSLDFVISMGGDGTFLDTVCYVGASQIPILGINLGRLGFLAGIRTEEINLAVEALARGAYEIERRTLMHLDSNLPLFNGIPFALNEFTIHKKDTSSMIKIHTYLNGEFLNTYWADGLIVSTPTGSTGYSMSCGGPIVFPQAANFVITAVAPHNLNIRPIVVPDDYVISFEVEGRADSFLCTLDARMETIDHHIQLAIRKENFHVNMVRLNENNFLQTMRTKLYWGMDKRN